MVRQLNNGEEVKTGKKTIVGKSQLTKSAEDMKARMAQALGTKVNLTCTGKGNGKITILFDNEEELQRITNLLDQLK